MISVTYKPPDPRYIEINGKQYQILLPYVESIRRVMQIAALQTGLSEVTAKQAADVILQQVDLIGKYIDDLLGVDAKREITSGSALGLQDEIDLYTLVTNALLDEYKESINNRYGAV